MTNFKKNTLDAVSAFKSGKIIEAEILVKKLIEINPRVAFLYNLLGLILYKKKEINKALEAYEKGIEIDSNFANIYNNIGILLYNNKFNGNQEKIESLYKKAILLDKNLVEGYLNLGNLYKFLNKTDEAIKYYKKSIDINPKFIFGYISLASVYISLGEINKATVYLKETININPKTVEAHRLLSRITKYKLNTPHLKEMEKLYNNIKSDNKEDKMILNFALGKAFEDIKNYDLSFKHYDEANKINKKKINFSINEHKNSFEQIKNVFNNSLFDKFKNSGFSNETPIFIVGMPRSGTTLVEQILSSHKKVFGADEIEFLPQLISENFKKKDLFANFINLKEENLNKIGKNYCKKIKTLSKNSSRVTDKLPLNFLLIGFIKLILPKSKIIHCIRKSEDVSFSIFKNYFTSGKINFSHNLNDIVSYYNLYQELMKHWNNLLPNFIHNINYEMLIKNTKKEVEKLINFCDLNWDQNCLTFYNNKRVVKTASNYQTRNKIYSTSINSWKNYEKHLKIIFDKLID